MSKLDELIDDTRRNAVWFEKNKYSKKPVNYDIGSPVKVTKEKIKNLILDLIKSQYKEISESHMINLVSGDGGAYTMKTSLEREVEKL